METAVSAYNPTTIPSMMGRLRRVMAEMRELGDQIPN